MILRPGVEIRQGFAPIAASPPVLCKAFSIFVGYSPRRLKAFSLRVLCAAGWPIPAPRYFLTS